MISTLKKKDHIYYCSNCMMRQYELRPNCIFCGNMFSNYEDIIIKEEIEKNEGNIRRTNRET